MAERNVAIPDLENEQHADFLLVQNDASSSDEEEEGRDEEDTHPLPQDCNPPNDVSPLESPEYTYELRLNATSIFTYYMRKCSCKPICSTKFSNALQMPFSFAVMKQTELISLDRAILFPVTASADSGNELSGTSSTYAQTRKRKRRDTTASPRATTVYALKGVRVCRHAFSAIVQLNPKTVNVHAESIAKTEVFNSHATKLSNARGVDLSIQSLTALLILQRYSELNAMSCPTARGSSDDVPVRWLPTDATKIQVHESYKAEWSYLVDIVIETKGGSGQRPIGPLSKDSFSKVWSAQYLTLRILKSGSDFCDTSTQLKNMADTITDVGSKTALFNASSKHRQEAFNEFKYYRDMQYSAKTDQSCIHLVFDFAEKVLLPSMLRQPGQLYFITGLKFDIFGVSCSSLELIRSKLYIWFTGRALVWT